MSKSVTFDTHKFDLEATGTHLYPPEENFGFQETPVHRRSTKNFCPLEAEIE